MACCATPYQLRVFGKITHTAHRHPLLLTLLSRVRGCCVKASYTLFIVFFFLPPPSPLEILDTQGAFLPSLSFCPVINGACRGHGAKVRGPQEIRSVFGCKNSKASWTHRNAPLTWLCQSWDSILPSTVGMSIVHTNTSVPAEQHSNVHTVV